MITQNLLRFHIFLSVALAKDVLLPIEAKNQVCSEFGLYPRLPGIKELYDQEDLLFFANTGMLSQPVNKNNYGQLTNIQLFAHNHMTRETQKIDPYGVSPSTGVLGRMNDELMKKGHNAASFSLGSGFANVGRPDLSSKPVTLSQHGVGVIYLDGDVRSDLPKLHNTTGFGGSIFADSWSASLINAIGTNKLLGDELNNVATVTEFPDSGLGNNFKIISRLIATHASRGSDMDTFFVSAGGEIIFC